MSANGDPQEGAGQAEQDEKDPAASMLLLQTITENALDPSYRKMAKRPKKKSFLIELVVFALIVALTFTTTVAARSLRAGMEQEDDTLAEMREHVRTFEETNTALEDENAKLVARTKGLQAFSSPEGGPAFPLQLAASSDQVIGPGVVVQVSDGGGGNGSAAHVTDSDLRVIMNILWQADAEAMAINGKRIGLTTTVRTAGSAILVNVAPIASPYVIEAIGDPGLLLDALEVGETGREIAVLETRIGVSASRSPRLVLPGLSPDIKVAVHPEQENEEPE